MHINSISCGQGAPSVYLIVAAGQGVFPADIVIVADTGDENDMLWSTGERTTAREYFSQVTKPLAEEFGLDAAFIRTLDRSGSPLPPIHLDQKLNNGKVEIDMPLFGSRGGRLSQACTQKYKVRAIRQELRRRGAKTATSNLGITMDEVERIRPNDVQWETLAWPLVMVEKLYRATIVERLKKMNIPYLVSSECDHCPHKDFTRWKNTSPEMLKSAAEWESQFDEKYFLTEYRIPLLDAVSLMKSRQPEKTLLDVCGGICFT